MSNEQEAKDRVVSRLRSQYEELTGKQPDAKVAAKMERQAAESLNRVANRERVWTPGTRR